jgi:hypothetical protein
LRYEVLVADHATRQYDFGFTAYKPLRPSFIVTFWPTLAKVKVRAVMESPNLDALQHAVYDVAVKTGVGSPSTVHAQANVPHAFGSRWTRSFWINGAPPEQVNVDHNLAYLAATGVVPNFDPANTVPAALLNTVWSQWQAAPKGLYDRGLWTRYMPQTGMREDIGLMPAWAEMWLSSGDWRMRQVTLGQADLAGAWPMQFREHDTKLRFDRAATVAAPGHPISLNAHPTLWFPTNGGIYAGAISASPIPGVEPWVSDGAHQPEPFGLAYLLTGDTFYLESLQLWSAAQAISRPPGRWGRGADGMGGITDQVRGQAWMLRSRALAAALSADGSPQKRYFHELMDDALAFWIGQRGIDDPAFANHPNRAWAAANAKLDWSPLRFWERDTSLRKSGPWQESFLLSALGVVRDQGFPTDAILREYSKVLTGQFTTPGHDPRLLGTDYVFTMGPAPGYAWYGTWSELSAKNLAEQPARVALGISNFELTGDPLYAVLPTTAAATLTGYDGGLASWSWLKAKVHDRLDMSGQYRRWKLLPRAAVPAAPPRPAP